LGYKNLLKLLIGNLRARMGWRQWEAEKKFPTICFLCVFLMPVWHEALAGLSERGTKSVKKIYGVFEFFPKN